MVGSLVDYVGLSDFAILIGSNVTYRRGLLFLNSVAVVVMHGWRGITG
jgi:hypothetical protein